MTLGNKFLRVFNRYINKLSVGLHTILYTEDKLHYTTKYRAGKKCVNICSYCGNENSARVGVHMPEFSRELCSPVYINNILGSEFTAYPQVLESIEFLANSDNKDMPMVCDNCGRVYSSILIIKTVDILVLLYY